MERGSRVVLIVAICLLVLTVRHLSCPPPPPPPAAARLTHSVNGLVFPEIELLRVAGLGNQLFTVGAAVTLAVPAQRLAVVPKIVGRTNVYDDVWHRLPAVSIAGATIRSVAETNPAFTNMSALESYGAAGDNIELKGYRGNWRFLACCGLEGVRVPELSPSAVPHALPVPRSHYPGYTSFARHFGHLCRALEPSAYAQSRLKERLDAYGLVAFPSHLVCVHVRRGDSVAKSTFHLLLPMSWYEDAIAAVETRLGVQRSHLHFYIFSDDIPWCRAQRGFTSLPHVTFVEPPPNSLHSQAGSWVEMLFMAQFRSRITGPSTFSWWAAMFSHCKGDDYPEAVVMPSKWFHKSQTKWNSRVIPALLMPDWITVAPF